MNRACKRQAVGKSEVEKQRRRLPADEHQRHDLRSLRTFAHHAWIAAPRARGGIGTEPPPAEAAIPSSRGG
jgi:hypothetical protein